MACLASFVTDALAPRHRLRPPQPSAEPPYTADPAPIGDQLIADLRDALRYLDSSPRHEWVANGHALKGLGEPGYAAWIEWSRRWPQFNQEEADEAWATFNPTNTSYRAIFAKAQANGWRNPGRWNFPPVDGTAAFHRMTGQPRAWPSPTPITSNEWTFANTSPPAIIEYLVYADVGVQIAQGGTGKTTFNLWLGIHIVLGIDFAGRKIASPGRVAILTAEDSRELLVARLRMIASAMFPHGVTPFEEHERIMAAIRDGFVIIDVSASVQRLTYVDRDVVRVDETAVDALSAHLGPLSVSLLMIDPAVSFGVGESRVNDAEQGLIEAARRLRRNLGCAVIYVHHTGKSNGRDKTTDQYSGRGGSAFPDGSRMVFVMVQMNPKEWQGETGTSLEPGETGLKVHLPKLSYCPQQKPIHVRRTGYKFEYVAPNANRDLDDDAKVLAFIEDQLRQGIKHNQKSLEDERAAIGVAARDKIRSVIHRLVETSKLFQQSEPGKAYWLIPVGVADPNREGV